MMEALVLLDNLMYELKSIPETKLKRSLVNKLNEFLHENELNTDQHNFVDLAKAEKALKDEGK